MEDHLPPEEGYEKTGTGLFVPKEVQQQQPNRKTRRDIMRQIRSHNNQERKKQIRLKLKEKNG